MTLEPFMILTVAQVVVGLPVEGPFDYFIPEKLRSAIVVGQRVRISFNRRIRIGYVVGLLERSQFPRIIPLFEILDSCLIFNDLNLKLAKQISEHYGCSWGEALELFVPRALRSGRRSTEIIKRIDSFLPGKHEVSLIHDHSRVKRWDIIRREIGDCLQNKKSVIVLVPELIDVERVVGQISSLAKETLSFVNIKSPKDELAAWIKVKEADSVIAVGVRSSIFAPVKNLGLIIVLDEEHESYQQEQSPHYHAREVAVMRAKLENCKLLLVSSSPSVETYAQALDKKIKKVELLSEVSSQLTLVDMTNYNPQKSSLLSYPMRNHVEQTLKDKGKVVLLMGRKGFSLMTRCNECGHTLLCQRCGVNMVYLYGKKKLVCRLCASEGELPKICPKCHGKYLKSSGVGAEKLESDMARLFPEANILYVDKDVKTIAASKNMVIATNAILAHLEAFSPDLIGVLQFDLEINRYDFRSAEKAFSRLIFLQQMAKKKVVVQTKLADNYVLKAAQKMDFEKFYREELDLREELNLPPFGHMVNIRLRGLNEIKILEDANALFNKLKAKLQEGIEILDPQADRQPKLRDYYRFNIVLRGEDVELMIRFVKENLKGFRRKNGHIVAMDVDC